MPFADLVNAPAVMPPKHNLVSSGNRVSISTDKWENGVTFTPRGCYQIEGTCATCPPADKEELQECVEAAVFGPYVLDLGVSLYAPDREAVSEFAEDDLIAGTSSRLEALIWSGCAGVDNPELSEGISLGGALSPLLSLAKMSAELISATGHGGAQGTIHMSPYIGVQLSEHLYCDHESDQLYTKVGYHHVIIGNYPTTHIAGHVGDIDVYLGDPFTSGSKVTQARQNLTALRWERLALATWNPCAVFTQAISA